jgi:hypothetical protein
MKLTDHQWRSVAHFAGLALIAIATLVNGCYQTHSVTAGKRPVGIIRSNTITGGVDWKDNLGETWKTAER